LASGRETKEIARCFDISQGRVESHIDALHDKAANRDLDLARSVIEQGRVQCAN
jgi:DNA-binding CsgD family transcriptional regulator